MDALVGSRPGRRFGDQSIILHDEIGSDDHPDVVDLQTLAGVDAADLPD